MIVRFTDFFHSLRAELKISTFDREFLMFRLKKKIRSCPFVVFVNAFDLYKNMYRALIEIYIMPISLCYLKRQKSQNNFVFTLKFHDAMFKNIMTDFHIDIKVFDRDCQLQINDKLI